MEYYLATRKNEIWPFLATWMELESVMLSEISHTEKDRNHMFSLLDPEKLNRRPWGRGRGKIKLHREKEANHKRLLKTDNNLMEVGGQGRWVMGIEEGTYWDEHWVLYGNQFENKFHILKKICSFG